MAQRVRFSEFWFLYGQTFRQMGRLNLWLPVLILGLVAFMIMELHYYVFSPVAGPIVRAWAELIKPELAGGLTHYPGQFIVMPYFFGNARLLVNIFLEAFLFGAMIDMLIALHRGERPAFVVSFKAALRRYLPLTLVWFLLTALLYLVNIYFFDFVDKVIGYSLVEAPRRQFMASLALRGVTVLLYMPCIYLLPAIMVGGKSLGQSIKSGFAVFARHPFITLGLVLVPYIFGVIPSIWASESVKVVTNFFPEMVYYLILISIAVDVIVNFVLLGTSVKFFMDQSD
ncbi:MAG: hypothetical protein GY841_11425 [FCB group bacterium]|nr:hypothetical protein [FCB group bacterium]